MIAAHAGDSRERNRFIAQLSTYAIRKRHTVFVVFDGGPYDRSYSERISGIQVVYSGARQTADEYICDYLERHKHAEIVLVSSDHELSSCADKVGIPSIDSHSFYTILLDTLLVDQQHKMVQKKLKSGEGVTKLHDDTSAEFDAYMEAASQTIPAKSADARVTKIELARNKVARNDRRLLKILKKL